jgi:hypothetical protein
MAPPSCASSFRRGQKTSEVFFHSRLLVRLHLLLVCFRRVLAVIQHPDRGHTLAAHSCRHSRRWQDPQLQREIPADDDHRDHQTPEDSALLFARRRFLNGRFARCIAGFGHRMWDVRAPRIFPHNPFRAHAGVIHLPCERIPAETAALRSLPRTSSPLPTGSRIIVSTPIIPSPMGTRAREGRKANPYQPPSRARPGKDIDETEQVRQAVS